MQVLDSLIAWLEEANLGLAMLALFAENALVMVLALGLGHWLAGRYARQRVAPPPPALEVVEVAAAISCLLLNTVVTIAGLLLWRQGIIQFRRDVGVLALLDVVLLLLVMDFAMYVLHRVAHHPWLYPFLHRMHHRFDRPRPLTLFVLNPAETLSFGALWLAVVSVYSWSWLGMSIYLTLNVLFGTIGHLGVEPFPPSWPRLPVLKYLAGSSFHARHHQDLEHNFGFYTLVWDRLFGTLRPDYVETFGQVPDWTAEARESR